MGGLLQLIDLLEKVGNVLNGVAQIGIPGVDKKVVDEINADISALKEIALGHVSDPNKNAILDWLLHGGNRHGTPESRAAEDQGGN